MIIFTCGLGRKSHCVRLDKQDKYVVASRLVSAQSARKKRTSCGDGAMAGKHLDDVNVWERTLFMAGHKRVAVISDAASTGKDTNHSCCLISKHYFLCL